MNPTPMATSADDPGLYFLGLPWDGDALAAVLAGGLALLTLIWTVIAFCLTRGRLSSFEKASLDHQVKSAAREQHWREITGAISLVLGKSKKSQVLGITLLRSMKNAKALTDADRLQVVAVLNAIAGG